MISGLWILSSLKFCWLLLPGIGRPWISCTEGSWLQSTLCDYVPCSRLSTVRLHPFLWVAKKYFVMKINLCNFVVSSCIVISLIGMEDHDFCVMIAFEPMLATKFYLHKTYIVCLVYLRWFLNLKQLHSWTRRLNFYLSSEFWVYFVWVSSSWCYVSSFPLHSHFLTSLFIVPLHPLFMPISCSLVSQNFEINICAIAIEVYQVHSNFIFFFN